MRVLLFIFLLSSNLLLALEKEYLQAEQLRVDGKIHKAAAIEVQIEAECGSLERNSFQSLAGKEKARALYLCSLERVRQLNSAAPISQYSLAQKIEKNLSLLATLSPDPLEKLFAEGKLYSELPPGYGQNFGKALVSLESLRRLDPKSAAALHALRNAYLLQGNRGKAEELEPRNLPEDRRVVDGASYGVVPSLFVNPSLGFGVLLSAHDDRVFDGDWSVRAKALATTRGIFAASADSKSENWIKEYGVRLSGSVFTGKEDFYGVGPNTHKEAHTELKLQRSTFGVAVEHALWQELSFRLGWKFDQAVIQNFSDPNGLFNTGPFAAFVYDTRDSLKEPHNGKLFLLQGYFPTEKFEKWTVQIERSLYFSPRTWVTADLATAFLRRTPPFFEYEMLGGSFHVPGTRVGRFRDKNVLVGWAHVKHRVWGPLTLGAFSSAGNIASEWGKLFETTFKYGGGLSADWHFSRFRGPDVQLEAGYQGGEFLVGAGVGWTF